MTYAPDNYAPDNKATATSVDDGRADDGIHFRVRGNPDQALLTLQIPQGGSVYADTSAIVCLDPCIRMRRPNPDCSLDARYKSYINRFCAEEGSGEVSLAAKLPGGITGLHLTYPLTLRVSCYLACSAEIRFAQEDSATGSGFSAEYRDQFLQCQGPGLIWLSGCGGIIQIELHQPLRCKVDRILAWRGQIRFGGVRDDVTEVSGNGTLWLQTLSEKSLGVWASSLHKK